MTILIGSYEFEGPVTSLAEVPSCPGLYAVLHEQNRDLLLVDLNQSSDLCASLMPAAHELPSQMVVVLPCESAQDRREILNELLREFEFDDESLTQTSPGKRTETKSGVGLVI